MAARDEASEQDAVPGAVRVDKWLWAARCFKTRSLASEACDAGHCQVDGRAVKPAHKLRPGSVVEVQTPGGLRVLEVVALAEKRGPAAVAAGLYVDRSPPPPPRPDAIARLLGQPILQRDRGAGRPTKRDRRKLDHTRGAG